MYVIFCRDFTGISIYIHVPHLHIIEKTEKYILIIFATVMHQYGSYFSYMMQINISNGPKVVTNVSRGLILAQAKAYF